MTEYAGATEGRNTDPRTVAEFDAQRRTLLAQRRAERRTAGPHSAQQAKTAHAPAARRLGTTHEKSRGGQPENGLSPEAMPAQRMDGRDGRMRLLEGLQPLSTSKRLKSCRRWLIGGAATVAAGATGASFMGTQTCGNVHLCPMCSARIRSVRADQADDWVIAWKAAGHGVALLTLTMRHFKRQKLGSLRKRERHGLVAIQHDAWLKAIGSKASPEWRRRMKREGVLGYYRVWECTFGESGPHPHWHALLFLDRPWDADQAAAFQKAVGERWSRAVVAAGGYKPGNRGARVDIREESQTGGAVGRYLFKDQAGKASIASEITRGDAKTAKLSGRMPFEVAAGAADGVADDVDLWREFERATYGLRLHYLSHGMRARLDALVATDDREDQEIAEDEGERTPVAVIPAEVWKAHVIPHRGRRLELLHAAEEKFPADAVRRTVEEWGLVWGRDVLDPPRTG